MEEETILKKLERLFKMRRLLKERKLKRVKDKSLKYGRLYADDEDDEEEEDLLSRPELIEEALKEYMYQFGLSIYQNRQGDYYFKQFADDVDMRGFDELDAHHFVLRENEPNFFEKLMETEPENKIQLIGDMETTVLDLYEKDAVMADILDGMVANELSRCREILRADGLAYDEPQAAHEMPAAEKTAAIENVAEPAEISGENRVAAENADAARAEEFSGREEPLPTTGTTDTDGDGDVAPASTEGEQWEAYQCGEERVEKAPLRKPVKVRRVRRQPTQTLPAGLAKENVNNR